MGFSCIHKKMKTLHKNLEMGYQVFTKRSKLYIKKSRKGAKKVPASLVIEAQSEEGQENMT